MKEVALQYLNEIFRDAIGIAYLSLIFWFFWNMALPKISHRIPLLSYWQTFCVVMLLAVVRNVFR